MSLDFIHSTPDRCPVLPRAGCRACGGPVVRSRLFLDYITCQRQPHYFASFDWDDRVWRDVWRDKASWAVQSAKRGLAQ